MRNGTYTEAIKAGFTDEQAGMLARLGMETRNEAIEAMTTTKPPHPIKKLAFAIGLPVALFAVAIWLSAFSAWLQGYPAGRVVLWLVCLAVFARVAYLGWHYSDSEEGQ